ncbi:MAG: NADH-quinone oxidoreductase subunit NuoK [Candidatus Ancaeobacter aquaticus]|nr:NADH-quinone oxidoreductase subunit NuoK [Candidatus Ancaeobacter aquaticus]
MNIIPVSHFLVVAALLFVIGLYGVLTRRNTIGILMSIELMLNAANINFLVYSRVWGNEQGLIFVIFVIATAAAATIVGLAILIAVYRQAKTIYADRMNLMRW